MRVLMLQSLSQHLLLDSRLLNKLVSIVKR